MRRRQPGFILIVISALVALALLVAVGWYALDGGSEEPARDLVGLTEVAAVREVQTRRLQVRIVRRASREPVGTVIDQNRDPGTGSRSTIVLVVSTG